MFRRRKNMTILQRSREFVWPRMGWLRAGTYIRHRVARLPGSPYSIAAGLACGAAVSFTPFIGLHFVLAALIAWLIGGNLIASAIGTVVGNPWTFPFVWWGTLRLGELILGSSRATSIPERISLHYIFDHPCWGVCGWPTSTLSTLESCHLALDTIACHEVCQHDV